MLQINTPLMNKNVEEKEFSNDISFSTNLFIPTNIDSDVAVNFIKNMIFNNNIKEDTTLKKILEFVETFQMKEKEDSLFILLNMKNIKSFNNNNDNLKIDDMTKQRDYPLLSTLNVPFTSHTMSTLLYEIVKSSQEFPNSSIMNINHP